MKQEDCDVPMAAFEGCWKSSFWTIKISHLLAKTMLLGFFLGEH